MALGCSLRELRQRVDSYELEQWKQYYALEPWGFPWERIVFGLLTSTLLNVNGGKSNGKGYTVDDIFPDKRRKSVSANDDEERKREMLAELLLLARPKG